MRRIVFRQYGGPEVLHLEEAPRPSPGEGEVLVRVAAAGLNPVDYKLFSGKPTFEPYERSLPSGNGYDFSGFVAENGSGATAFAPGDRVFGGLRFHAQADYLVTAETSLVRVPDGLSMVTAGALNVVGRTAVASVASQQLRPGESVLVSAAAGGVGVLAAQLAREAGARVLGTASPRNHDYLRSIGIEPVSYGPNLVDDVRRLAPEGLTAVLDNVGHGTIDAAIDLGVPPARINTIADYPAIAAYGVRGVGGATAGVKELAHIAGLIAAGAVDLPIDTVHPLEDAAAAYVQLMEGHARGKIVLIIQPAPATEMLRP
ncbi:NADP-dependent oxidoreductase [Microbacterium murale]|uniref:NADPH:quinone reductase-like Zn-dependent oxidoreductase n=1 Tax=Microbacterium murale TaxID=1081040 RepID=A0ABU0PAA4_9MICO|nr:NADP-dependent oxidoreductase [Microbacterium murale]MDQ0644264.1 NADPH:quinone reductase-like Zn-dependent oxidoreductase [Microbacterium murale]